MNHDHQSFADDVWRRTLPALRRKRARRRAFRAASTAIVLGFVTLSFLRTGEPESPQRQAPAVSTSPPLPEPSSFAVLVVDQSGVRFHQLRPDELAGEGLDVTFTLDPVITSTLFGFQ